MDADRLERHLILRLAVERALAQLVDLAGDINSHVCAVSNAVEPTDYRSSFAQAREVGLIDSALAEALTPSVGLRNVVIHHYVRVDLSVVAAAVPRAVRDFESYIAQVKVWVSGRR